MLSALALVFAIRAHGEARGRARRRCRNAGSDVSNSELAGKWGQKMIGRGSTRFPRFFSVPRFFCQPLSCVALTFLHGLPAETSPASTPGTLSDRPYDARRSGRSETESETPTDRPAPDSAPTEDGPVRTVPGLIRDKASGGTPAVIRSVTAYFGAAAANAARKHLASFRKEDQRVLQVHVPRRGANAEHLVQVDRAVWKTAHVAVPYSALAQECGHSLQIPPLGELHQPQPIANLGAAAVPDALRPTSQPAPADSRRAEQRQDHKRDQTDLAAETIARTRPTYGCARGSRPRMQGDR